VPDTLLWSGKNDNSNAFACPVRFYGLVKWIDDNGIDLLDALLLICKMDRWQWYCLSDAFLMLCKMDRWQWYCLSDALLMLCKMDRWQWYCNQKN